MTLIYYQPFEPLDYRFVAATIVRPRQNRRHDVVLLLSQQPFPRRNDIYCFLSDSNNIFRTLIVETYPQNILYRHTCFEQFIDCYHHQCGFTASSHTRDSDYFFPVYFLIICQRLQRKYKDFLKYRNLFANISCFHGNAPVIFMRVLSILTSPMVL